MRMVEENLGWKRSREGPAGKGTLAVMRGTERRSYTCILLSSEFWNAGARLLKSLRGQRLGMRVNVGQAGMPLEKQTCSSVDSNLVVLLIHDSAQAHATAADMASESARASMSATPAYC